MSNVIPDTDLFYTTERVDSIFHVLSFIVTHPAYMGEAVKALKMSKVPLLGLLDLCGPRDGGGSSQKDLADHIHRSSSGMIVLLVVFLLIQIIALFAFITSMSYPECTDNSDCPLTTYCYSGPLTRTITGYGTGCISCGFLDAGRRNGLTSLMYPVTLLPDNGTMPETCEVETYSNNHGNTFNGCVAMILVSLVVSLNLAKEEGEIMLTDIFLRRSGFSWWRFTYYDDDETYMKRNNVGVINQAR